MKPSLRTLISIGFVIMALLSWAGVWYVFEAVRGARSAHLEILSQIQSRAVREEAQVRVRALSVETSDERAILAASAQTGVIEAGKILESVGPAADVELKVLDVSKLTVAVTNAAAPHPLDTYRFSVQATGSYAAIMKAAQLLDELPLVSRVEQFDISQVSGDGGGDTGPVWRLAASINLLTEAHAL